MHSSSVWVQELKPKSHGWLYIMAIKGLCSSDKDKPLHYAVERIFFEGTVWNSALVLLCACVVRVSTGILWVIPFLPTVQRHTFINFATCKLRFATWDHFLSHRFWHISLIQTNTILVTDAWCMSMRDPPPRTCKCICDLQVTVIC